MVYRRMKKTTNQGQFEIMVAYVQQHPELMKPLTPGAPEASSNRRQLWDGLSKLLNDKGPPSRSSTEWRSIWSDYKYNLKRKLCTDNKCARGKRRDKRHLFNRLEGKVIKMLKLKQKPCIKHHKPKGKIGRCKEHTLDHEETATTQCKEEPSMSDEDNEESVEVYSDFGSEGERSGFENDFNATEVDEPLNSDEAKEQDNIQTMNSDVRSMLKDTLLRLQQTQLEILKALKECNQQKNDTRYFKEQELQLEREKFEEQKKQNSEANKRAALELELKRKELELYQIKLKGSCTDCIAVKTENVEYIVSNY